MPHMYLFSGEVVNRIEANLCWPSTSLVLPVSFVWLMSECDTLLVLPMSEPHIPSTELMSYVILLVLS